MNPANPVAMIALAVAEENLRRCLEEAAVIAERAVSEAWLAGFAAGAKVIRDADPRFAMFDALEKAARERLL